MKMFFDLFPLILFFVTFKLKGIYWATGVAMAAAVAQIAWSWFKHRKVDTMLWVGLAVITVFGGATLFLHNEMFIKWKPTVLYSIMGGALLVGRQFFNKNFLRVMLAKQLQLTDTLWDRLNTMWGCFFLFLAGLNLVVAYNVSTATWVNYKLFGTMGLMLAFVLVQGIMLAPHMPKEQK
jgi:intracellular septation protein